MCIQPDRSYRVYGESVCCINLTIPECNGLTITNAEISSCFSALDVGPSPCGFEPNAQVATSEETVSSLLVSWDDPPVLDNQTYEITAIPTNVSCQNNVINIPAFVLGLGDLREFRLTNLLPNTEYEIMVFKACPDGPCGRFTTSIRGTGTTMDIDSTVDIFTMNNCSSVFGGTGRISVNLEEQPTSYVYQLLPGNITGIWDNQLMQYNFDNLEAGTYTLTISECPSLSWPNLIIEDVACAIDISVDQEECTITADLENCNGEITEWFFRENQNGQPQGLGVSDPIIEEAEPGFYFYTVNHQDCGEVVSEEVHIENCEEPLNLGCATPDADFDFIIEAGNSSVISDFLDTGQSSIENSIVFISGNLIIDTNFRFIDCEIYMSRGSDITVEDGNAFILLNSTSIQRCDPEEMWEGITINSGGRFLSSSQSSASPNDHRRIISGANAAITLQDNSTILLFSTTFTDNRFGILAIDDVNNLQNQSFSDNLFETTGDIELDISIGIIASDINNFNFANRIASRFERLDAAIITNRCAVTFENINILSCISGIRIDNTTEAILEDINIEDVTSGITISDPRADVTATGVNIINQATGLNGIRFSGGSENINVNFDGLSVSNFLTGIACSGTNFDGDFGLNSISLCETAIDLFDADGLHFFGHNQNDPNHVHIDGSNVLGSVAINALLSDNLLVENLSMEGRPSVLGEQLVFCSRGDGVSLKNNILSGPMDLVLFENVDDHFFCSNTFLTENNFMGVQLDNCGVNSLEPTYALNHHIGENTFDLSITGSSIGNNNVHAGNTWEGNGSNFVSRAFLDPSLRPIDNIFAVASGSNLRPANSNLDPNEFDRWFDVQQFSSDQTISDCPVGPVTRPSGGNPYACCDAPHTSIEKNECCPIFWPVICDRILEIIEQNIGGNPYTILSPSQLYNAYLTLLQQKYHQGNSEDFLDEDCYTTVVTEMEGEGNAEHNVSARLEQVLLREQLEASMSPSLELQSEIDAHYQTFSDLRLQANAIDPEDNNASVNLQTINQQLNQEHAILTALWKDHKQNRKATAHAVMDAVSSLTILEPIDFYHHQALEIEAFLNIKELDDLSDEYISDLEFMAELCAYEYGHPVYFSRNVLYKLGGAVPYSYDDAVICFPLESRQLVEQEETNYLLELFPNPTKETLHIGGILPQEVSLLTIHDQNGQKVYATKLAGDKASYKIDVRTLPAGIYIINLKSNDTLIQKKFLKLD